MFMVDHFKYEKIHQITIYRLIRRAEINSGNERASGSGQMVKVMTTNNIQDYESNVPP